ncbi:Flp pilus assembly protein CpaB [Halomonas sp. 328]|uniref:Flp pilus assembly protein CpaB n=1 Tax=Halomonas sp. 328 TaxID=2776704 RepID=UPI0018A7971C|nr:Flp pilus assembly protein CpaB [Halomonas sp. 328]MBF8221314.1 Flp pilus assembly protein CpaB [Halomonas sp. 328]
MSPNLLKGIAAVLVAIAIGLAFAGWQLTRDLPPAMEPAPVVEAPSQEAVTPGFPVLTAAKRLEIGTRLEARPEAGDPLLRRVDYPVAVAESFADLSEVEGRVLTRPLAPGDILRPEHFTLGGLLAEAVPPGKRALAVSIDEVIGGGGFIAPGDRVDVFYYAQTNDSERAQLARRLFRDVEVLSFGAELRGMPADNDRGPQRSGRTAVLALDEEQAPRLLLAETTGRLRLAVIGASERAEGLASGVDNGRLPEGLPGLRRASLEAATETEALGPVVLFRELTRIDGEAEREPAAAPSRAPRSRTNGGRQVIQHVGGETRVVQVPGH